MADFKTVTQDEDIIITLIAENDQATVINDSILNETVIF